MAPESSTEEEVQVAAVEPVAAADGKQPAPSSSADGEVGKSPATMLDAIRAVGQEKATGSEGGGDKDAEGTDPAAAAKTEGAQEKPEGGQAEEEELGELTDEELRRYKPKTQRRMRQLLGKVDAADARVADLSPKAESFDKMVTWVEQANLNKDEVNAGLEIMRLMKADPFKALEALKPYLAQLEQVTGTTLPTDLAEQVRTGYVTEPIARETARLRAERAHAETQTRAREEAEQARTTRETQSQAVAQVQGAFAEWEAGKLKSDPDYQSLSEMVLERLQAIWATKRDIPKTKDEASKQANEAYAHVKARMAKFRPTPAAINPVTGTGRAAASAPQPATMLDVVKQAVGR